MFLLISVTTKVILTFYSPTVPESFKVNSEEQGLEFDLNHGFPLRYLKGDILTSKESIYKTRSSFLAMLIFLFFYLVPEPAPANPIGLPMPLASKSTLNRKIV